MVGKQTDHSIVCLLVPPFTPPMVPNLGVPTLARYLRNKRIEVRQLDLNIRFYDEMINQPMMLSGLTECLQATFDRLDHRPVLRQEDVQKYLNVVSELSKARVLSLYRSDIARHYHLANPHLEPLPFGYPSQGGAFQLMNIATATFGVKRMALGAATGSSVTEPTGRPAQLLMRFFYKHLKPYLDRNISLFGISLLYDSQLACASLLARCLKMWFARIPIVAGGPLISRLQSKGELDCLRDTIDFFIVGEGEIKLAELHSRIDRDKETALMQPRILAEKKPLSRLLAPEFSKEDVPLYWSNPLTLPVQASRGCYWNRCAFCSYGACYSGPFRFLSPRSFVHVIKALEEGHGCTSYQIVDDCISPEYLSHFSDDLLGESVRISWTASVRFDPQFDRKLFRKISRAGCRRLTFGMETTSQRLLDYIRKGTRAESFLPILDDCKRCHIDVHLNWIVGLPSETSEELQGTLRFLLEHSDLYSYQFGHVFRLEPGSAFAEDPDAFQLPPLRRGHEYYSRAEERRLFEVVSSLNSLQDAKTVNENPHDQFHDWTSRMVKIRAHYNLEVLRAFMARTHSAEKVLNRMPTAKWLAYDPWNDTAGQFSNQESVPIDSGNCNMLIVSKPSAVTRTRHKHESPQRQYLDLPSSAHNSDPSLPRTSDG